MYSNSNKKDSRDQGLEELSPHMIGSLIQGRIGRKIFFFDTVVSTNVSAMNMAAHAEEGTVVIAESQGHGRGRHGRSWESPPGGNIYMSILLKPILAPREAMIVTLMAAVASAGALRTITGLDVMIKWPNDLLIQEKKTGGILTEMKTEGGRAACVIVGIGINVNADPSEFPAEVRKGATSLKKELGMTLQRNELVAEILNSLDRWYSILCTGGGRPVLDAWRRLSGTLGKEVLVTMKERTYHGVAESVNESGMLVLRLSTGKRLLLHAGDIVHLRDSATGSR